jgi:hypothetical protein
VVDPLRGKALDDVLGDAEDLSPSDLSIYRTCSVKAFYLTATVGD